MIAPKFLLLLCLSLGATLSGWAAPDPIVVTAADEGRVIELGRGREMNVALEGNRTTGFSWSLDAVPSAALLQLGEPIYTATPASPRYTGAGGVETWRFRAIEAGSLRLRFVYRRPFEKEVAPARMVTIQVQIR